MITKKTRKERREVRRKRNRKKVFGTGIQPRLSVFISLANVYAQIIDDNNGETIVAASTLEKEVHKITSDKNKTEASKVVGSLIAKRALEKGISEVIFDRSGYLYHGRVKALAEAARDAGLKF